MQCEALGDGAGGAVVEVGPVDVGWVETGGEVAGEDGRVGEVAGGGGDEDAPAFAGGVVPAGPVAEREGAVWLGRAAALVPGDAPAAVGTTSAGGLAGGGTGLSDDDVRAITAPPARATQAATATSGSHQRRAPGSWSRSSGSSGGAGISAPGYAAPGGVSRTARYLADSRSPVRGTAGAPFPRAPLSSGPASGNSAMDAPVADPATAWSQAAESWVAGLAAIESAGAEAVSRSSSCCTVGR